MYVDGKFYRMTYVSYGSIMMVYYYTYDATEATETSEQAGEGDHE